MVVQWEYLEEFRVREGDVIGAGTWKSWWERRGRVALQTPGGVAGTHKVPNDQRWYEK